MGLLSKSSMNLGAVKEIVALSRDALTHDEILIGFHTADGKELVISEFDNNFEVVVSELASLFPGLERWRDTSNGPAFEDRRVVLWHS